MATTRELLAPIGFVPRANRWPNKTGKKKVFCLRCERRFVSQAIDHRLCGGCRKAIRPVVEFMRGAALYECGRHVSREKET